jgi:hypothetical protein
MGKLARQSGLAIDRFGQEVVQSLRGPVLGGGQTEGECERFGPFLCCGQSGSQSRRVDGATSARVRRSCCHRRRASARLWERQAHEGTLVTRGTLARVYFGETEQEFAPVERGKSWPLGVLRAQRW